MTDLQRAREFFKNDRYATELTGIEIDEVCKSYAKCSLKLEKHHKNAMGNVMGGAIYTLADFTFAVATNFNADCFTVTSVSQVSYLNITKGETLYSESHLIKEGKTACFYEIDITDDLGTLVAKVNVSGIHINK